MAQLTRIELVKDLVQETVDRAVASVEQIHRTIAGLPFDVLAALGVPDPLRLRDRQRRVIGVVYGAVRDANRYVGELLSDGFEALEDGRHVARVLGDADSVSEAARGQRRRKNVSRVAAGPGEPDDSECMARPAVEISKLTAAERLQLVEELWESLCETPDAVPITDAHRAELARRLDDLEQEGPVGIPWDEVVRRIRKSG